MTNFTLSYEQAKILLNVFYNIPYQQAVPYVALLDALVSEDGVTTLRQTVEKEIADHKATAIPKTE